MNFARISLVSLGLIAAAFGSSVSQADESIMQIAKNKQEKQIVINFLRDRLNKHMTMTSEQIIADLNASATRNHALLLKQQAAQPTGTSQVDTAQNFEKLVLQETDKLRQYNDRDVIIALETARLQEVSSADNYMLYIMNHGGPALGYLVCTCGDPTISLIFAIFLVPFDIVALPIEFLLTAITGF
jgi:hypothetical protein